MSDRMSHHLDGTQSFEVLHNGPDLFVGDFRCRVAATGRGPEEVSRSHDIVFVRAGLFTREIRGHRTVADPNQVLFFNRDEPYRVVHPIAGGDDCLVLSLAADDLLDIVARRDPGVRDRMDRPFPTTHALCGPRAFLLQRRLVALLERSALSPLALQEMAFDLADEATAAVFDPVAPPATRPRPATLRRHREIAEGVAVLLSERFREPLTLHVLARAASCAPFHLSRLFRAHAGLPIHRYQTRLRLRAALDRLAEGERDITGLALDLGFADHSHFTNSFRREFGLPPSGFRRLVAAHLPKISKNLQA
jgi:AraC family transcriptional regulator